jgi:hypothetical protein
VKYSPERALRLVAGSLTVVEVDLRILEANASWAKNRVN